MPNSIPDSHVRKAALDTTKSILLRAPAGGGKTSVLVLRYMKLLTMVLKPEAVVAITFTKKSAGEMRERVMEALGKAQSGIPPSMPHEVELYNMASKVLTRSQKLNWELMKNPSRLQIKTIDALCSTLVNTSPLLSTMGGKVSITDQPGELYKQAAMSLLEEYTCETKTAEIVKSLLLKLDNNFERATTMLSVLLKDRELWLPLVLESSSQHSTRLVLESHSAQLINATLSPALNALSKYSSQLLPLFSYASQFLPFDSEMPLNVVSIPNSISNEEDRLSILHLVDFITTSAKKPSLRMTGTKANGFLPQSDFRENEGKNKSKEMKSLFKDLMAVMAKDDELTNQLALLKSVPSPKFEEEQWLLLNDLLRLLPSLVAHLLVIFNQTSLVDYQEISARALTTLSSEDSTTATSLRLDAGLSHILIDEVQDTNLIQFRLLEKLTVQWQPGDGKTLFMVGDPMQSIYKFRGANVGLFEKVSRDGLGTIELKSLSLTCNFRSQGHLVDFVNRTFQEVFPTQSDINAGAVSFQPSSPIMTKTDAPLDVSMFSGDKISSLQLEADRISRQITGIRTVEPKASIAILVRTRTDLLSILPTLRTNGVSHRAIDIRPLKNHTVIQDLVALTRAIFDLDDRAAWVGLLRSPLCGLSLQQIRELAPARPSGTYYQMAMESISTNMHSADVHSRIVKLMTVVNQSLQHISRKSVANIVKGAFIALSGLSTLDNILDIETINRFYDLLNSFGYNGFCQHRLELSLESLYAKEEVSDNQIQIMTIHRAKGLEFDYVFIPGCQGASRADEKRLISFELVTKDNGDTLPVLAPYISQDEGSPLADFIHSFNQLKKNYESQRVAYVAFTRAKKKTFLSGYIKNLPQENDGQQLADLKCRKHSVFDLIKSAIPDNVYIQTAEPDSTVTNTAPVRRYLNDTSPVTLPENDLLSEFRGFGQTSANKPELDDFKCLEEIVGSVICQILRQVAEVGISSFTSVDLKQYRESWRRLLIQAGLANRYVSVAINRVMRDICTVLHDLNSEWLFSKNHSNTQNEMELSFLDSGRLEHCVIDRTFVSSGTRYIINYVTDEPAEAGEISNFITKLLAINARRMDAARVAMGKIDTTPIKMALYFSHLGRLEEYRENSEITV